MSAAADTTNGFDGTVHGTSNDAVPIVHKIFGAFADALAAQPDRAAVAERLRKALVTDGARTEVALRAALFDGGDL
jgi:hypothetical protein